MSGSEAIPQLPTITMNVWIIYQNAIPPSQPGGTRHFTIAKMLKERGHQATIFSSSFNHFCREETRLYKGRETYAMTKEDGVPFVWIRTPSYLLGKLNRVLSMIRFAWRVWKVGKRNGNQLDVGEPDVIISSTPPMFAPLAAYFLAKRLKKPFFLEVRDLWPETIISFLRYSRFNPLIFLFSRMEKYLYKRADAIINVLDGAEDYMAQKGADKNKILRLPNAVDFRFIPSGNSLPSNDVFTIVYAGHHGFANNLEMVVKASAILRDQGWEDKIRFRLIGSGPYRPILLQMVREQGLSNVEFLPAMNKQDIFPEMKKADAFLMVLRNAAVFKWGISPNKLSDYLACGRPVLFGVSTDKNIVEKADAGLTFSPTSAESLAEAAKKLAQMDGAKRSAMGKNGREFALAHFNWEILMDSLEETLQQACPPSDN
ncbi:MAG: glycosyltransferase WbuB [Desulfovibrio sp.]|nr:MAG: glycosyltransferase WbuB [Desulfovibrio sp.]